MLDCTRIIIYACNICSANTHFDLYKIFIIRLMKQGWDSQNFLHKFVRFFVTLGIKILRLFRLKVIFEADINIEWC